MLLKNGVAVEIDVFMASVVDGITGVAGLTLTISARKAAGSLSTVSQAGPTNVTVVDKGSGLYTLQFASGFIDTNGIFTVWAADSAGTPTAITRMVEHQIVANLPGELSSSTLTSLAAAVWDALTSTLTTASSIGKFIMDNWTSARAAKIDNLDATISSRLADASYTAPDNSSITAIKAKTDNLPVAPASTSDVTTVGTALAAVQTDVDSLQTAVAAIPTNPLLTNDSRLNNLDATISSRLSSIGQIGIKKNTALAKFPFKVVDAAGAPATGLSLTMMIVIDGAAWVEAQNTPVEVGGGWYTIDFEAADLNGNCIGCDPLDDNEVVKPIPFTIRTQE